MNYIGDATPRPSKVSGLARACGLIVAAAVCGLVSSCCGCQDPINGVAGDLLVLKQNGGWCWFMDPRVIVDGNNIIAGTVAGASVHDTHPGDIEISAYALSSGNSTTFELHDRLDTDDHDSPAVLTLPDGRYLAAYTLHSDDAFMRWRITTRPGDVSEWAPEAIVDTQVGAGITYSNLFVLPSEANRIYNFYRGRNGNPDFRTATLDVIDFSLVGRLFLWDRTEATGADPEKIANSVEPTSPYPRYASNHIDTIHFITTEDHPRFYDTSIYHGFVRAGAAHDSFGNVVDGDLADDFPASPVEFTRVFEGDAKHIAWTTDIELDSEGNPYIAFSVQTDDARGTVAPSGLDHRYYYGRFDGTEWHVHEMAYAGTRLYREEDDYTGLVALDPADPDTVYISTNADPTTGKPLVSASDCARHFEIYRGKTEDFGATWDWTPITWDSNVDNIRPTIPAWEGHTALVWLRGTYDTMVSFDLDVVALIDP